MPANERAEMTDQSPTTDHDQRPGADEGGGRVVEDRFESSADGGGRAAAAESHIQHLARELERTEAALRRETAEREEVEAILAAEWADLERLQRIGTRLTGAEAFVPLLDEMLDAAITLMGADRGNVQLREPEADELWIAAHRGFRAPFLMYFARVMGDTASTCGHTLLSGERLIDPDVLSSDIYSEESKRVLREAGVRAVQSTPLVTRGGEVLGMLSTHWSDPHRPSEQSLRTLDLLARQAADLIERARREKELQEANQRLRSQRKRREDFLATLGHELRNPLGALDAALRVLRSGEQNRDRLQAIMTSQVSQLTRLVDDLLEVSRLTRGKVELRPERMDLVAAAQDACEDVQPVITAKGQRLDVIAPPSLPVQADPARIRQIVANLLDNAVEYSPEESRIELRIARDGDQALLSVRDEGVGIPADVLEDIFEPFVQADPGSGGLGIGLSLAHALAELHGGSLVARSEGPGRGAEFVFRMPAAHPQGPEHGPVDAGQLRLDGLRVLIVDDVEDAADLMGLLLSSRGCRVETAYGARDAVRKARNGRYDAVLLDLALPDGNGFEVARAIRAQDRDVTLIALTGFGDEETHHRVKEAGFAARLLKPVDPDALCELLHASLAGGSAGD